MYTFLIILFVISALLMTLTILMQSSKGGGLAASFGGMGGGGVFGPRGAANFLQKATTFLAIACGLICLLIGFVGRPAVEQNESVIQRGMQQQEQMQNTPLPVTPLPGEQGQQQLPQQQTPPPDQNQQGEESPSK